MTCEHCDHQLNVAGAYRRRSGHRKKDLQGRTPADGKYEWGRYTCDGCGREVVVPADEEMGCVG